jgi:hypothetical protein
MQTNSVKKKTRRRKSGKKVEKKDGQRIGGLCTQTI